MTIARRAIARPAQSRPLPTVCPAGRVMFSSGCYLVGSVEYRLERFDRGWVVTFAAEFIDGGVKVFVLKVYPMRQTEQDAIESVRRRASEFPIVKIYVLGVDEPGKSTGETAV